MMQELRRAVLVFVLHLAVVNSGTLQESLQLLVHNLNLPWALALQQADDCDREWQPSGLAVAVQDDIVTYIDKVRFRCITLLCHTPSHQVGGRVP